MSLVRVPHCGATDVSFMPGWPVFNMSVTICWSCLTCCYTYSVFRPRSRRR